MCSLFVRPRIPPVLILIPNDGIHYCMCLGKQATLTVLMDDGLPGFRDPLTALIDITHAFIKVLNLAGGEIYIHTTYDGSNEDE